jgi:hypothetical protein
MTTHTQSPSQKWDTFMYVRRETNFITNLFKKANVKIAFKTNNTIQKLLMHKQQKKDIHSQSGVYKLTCPDCGKLYVGQTGRNFATWFKEHKNAFRTASHSSNFAKHLIEHTFLRPLPQNHANTASTKQRSTLKHNRTILHLQRIHQE